MASNGNNNMFLLMMFALFGVVGVVFLTTMQKKSNTILQTEGQTLDVVIDNAGRIGVQTHIPGYEPKTFTGGTVFLPDPDFEKPGLIITSGSSFRRDQDPRRFKDGAIGTCQCDYNKCCYRSIYQPRHGGPEEETRCEEIHYGDVVDACERSVREFEEETFRVRAMSASRYGNHLVRSRMARALS